MISAAAVTLFLSYDGWLHTADFWLLLHGAEQRISAFNFVHVT